MSCYTPNITKGLTEVTSGPYANGSQAVFQCAAGYVMRGLPYVTCNNGTFVGTYPKCTDMSCSSPSLKNGLLEVTSGPYATGSQAVFKCAAGYVMRGLPYVTCDNGTFVGAYPKCDYTINNYADVAVNTYRRDELPSWLLFLFAAVLGLLLLLLFTCILTLCCHLCCGCGMFGGQTSADGVWCCRRRGESSETDGNSGHNRRTNQCTALPRRYFFDKLGRRFHYDDDGRPCYYNHKHQNGKSSTVPMEYQENSVIVVNEASEKKVAKEVVNWKPHANPVRNINTSTK